MAEDRPFDAEWTEIAKIDYLLDELARAVERGEVHRASYDLMAPRYLTRRAHLAAVISGRPVVEPRRAVPSGAPRGSEYSAGPAATRPAYTRSAPVRPVYTPSAPVRPPSKPVAWTTVLLFLGAFLVIVASAIFSIVIWDLLGATGKLVLLGLVTAAFYVAGWYVRVKLDVPAGATALTAVASAMLLFDGWIAIEGYGLEGPIPWAVLLLVCSLVYWYTEVRLAHRFFGVIGAAAQMGWWWLLGEGLGLPVITRLAGMSLVAVAWQIAAERGRGDKTVGSLATVLEWAAPISVGLLSLGVVADLALVRTAGLTECVAAAVVAGAAWFVTVRSRELDAAAARVIAAVLQLPLLAMLWVASGSGEAWWLFAGFLAVSGGYGAYALVSGRHPFAVLAVVTELSAALQLLALLDASDEVAVAALAGLAALWALASRMAANAAKLELAPPGVRALETVSRWASVVLLAACSFAVPVVMGAVPLEGAPVTQTHAMLAVAVLAVWIASTVAHTREAGLTGSALFSFYTLAALMAWLAPDQTSAAYASGLVVLAGAWLAVSRMLERVYDPLFVEMARWGDRLLIVIITLAGLLLEIVVFGSGDATIPAAVLAGLAALAFAYDALVHENFVTAGAASAFAVGTAALAAATVEDPTTSRIAVSLAGATAALAITAGCAALRERATLRPAIAAVTAASVGTLIALVAWGEPGWMALALLVVAAAWAVCAARLDEAFALPAGLALMGVAAATAAAVDAGTWPTVVLVGGASLALGAVALSQAFGPGGAHERAGGSLGIAGIAGISIVSGVVFLSAYEAADAGWLGLGPAEQAVLLLAFGAGVLLQGWRWRFEVGTYIGWALVLMAGWASWGEITPAGEWYTTTLALYLAGMGYLYVAKDAAARVYPVVLDAAAVAIGLGMPLLWSLTSGPDDLVAHFLWVFGLSIVSMAAGVMGKVRWYFFGGVAALVLVAVYRSFTTLAEFSWLLLGVIGIAMLVIAVTWEQQRSTRERLVASFHGWR